VNGPEIGVVLLTVAANAAVGFGGLARARFVRENSEQVGLPASWLPALGAIKLAGAAGLVVGLMGIPALGVAAAAGLALFFVCAVTRHVQTRVLRSIPFPGTFLVLALLSLLAFARQ
jgi:hypothetical protein